MWIIRFQKIKPKDYNFISRLLKKSWYCSRKVPDIVLVKGIILHAFQKRSWRSISAEFWASHICFYKFYNFIKAQNNLQKIFFHFIENRTIVYIKEKQSFDIEYLDNNDELIKLTKEKLESML